MIFRVLIICSITFLVGCGGGTSKSSSTKPGLSSSSSSSVAPLNVYIPDPVLKSAIQSALKMDSSVEVTTADMDRLTTLRLKSSERVSNLEGLQYAKNIEILVLGGDFSDLALLANLDSILDLTLFPDKVIDLSPIEHLPKLKSLELYLKDGMNLSFLSSLSQLNLLSIYNASPTLDITPINKLINLKHLDINESNLNVIPDISPLVNLESLGLSKNNITDISPLKNLFPLLNNLNLDFNPIENLEPLRGRSEFDHLGIKGTNVVSLDPVLYIFRDHGTVSATGSCISLISYYGGKEKALLGHLTVDLDFDINLFPYRQDCPDSLSAATLSVAINTENINGFTLEWQLSGAIDVVPGLPGQCKIFLNHASWISSLPFKTIPKCDKSSELVLTDTAYAPEYVTFIYENGFGNQIRKDIHVSQAENNPHKSLIQKVMFGQTVISKDLRIMPNRPVLLASVVETNLDMDLPESVDVKLALDGDTVNLKAQAAKRFGDLPATAKTDLYSVAIPQDWLKPGLTIEVSSADDSKIVHPVFFEPLNFYLTAVPVAKDLESVVPIDVLDIKNKIKLMWPFAEVYIKEHSPYISGSEASKNSVLDELEDIRVIEGDDVYYYGFISGHPHVGGVALMRGKTAVGDYQPEEVASNGYLPYWASVVLHELGHNFGRDHVDCGMPSGADEFYPYDPRSIGSIGISTDLTTFYSPKEYSDVMSYCDPQHVSDYTYNGVQDYLLSNPPLPFKSDVPVGLRKPVAANRRSLYISGNLNVNGEVSLRRLTPLNRGMDDDIQSDYILKVEYKNGDMVERHASVPVIDHPASNIVKSFHATIPFGEIETIKLVQKDVVLFTQKSNHSELQKLLQKSTFVPVVSEQANTVCLDWNTGSGTSASLIQHTNDQTTVLILDDEKGHVCSSTDRLPPHGEWQVLIRKGIDVQELFYSR